jgi:hypothetical protein
MRTNPSMLPKEASSIRARALRGLTLGAALALAPLLLMAQGTDPSTSPGPNDDDEEWTAVDPANLTYTSTLGKPMLPSVEDPSLYDFPPLHKGHGKAIAPLGLVPPPTAASGASLAAASTTSQHYFSYNGAPIALVGVSADNACHFYVTGAGQCNYGNYTTFINDVAAQGLNVIRLWVSIVGGPASTAGGACTGSTGSVSDNPFTYDASHGTLNGVGRFYLDSPNQDYFTRLFNVVSYAQSKNPNIFVEVTLFAPTTNFVGVGPYGAGHAYLSNQTRLTGFTDTANFTNANSAEYLAMKTYLFNVIHWTVDKLYSFPNIYFEVANEPEDVRLSGTHPPGCGNDSQTDPATVAAWQNAIATELKNYETINYVNTGKIARNHLVAVEPLTTTAADTFVGSGVNASAGSVINSHYTTINPQGSLSPYGLGSIKMIRMYNSQAKIFGFNETKITCGGGNTGGSVDAGRAEAWEFMADQGGVYDQFGYNCGTSDYTETRRQMGVLRRFLANQQVNVVYGTRTSDTTAPSWVNPGQYAAFESATSSHKFWAALEPTNNAANKRWLLYVHHSNPRNLVNDGYSAVITAGAYRENLSVCLGAASGNYVVRWVFDPKNAVDSAGNFNSAAVRTDSFFWPGATTCTPGGAGSIPLQQSPPYNYDLALSVSTQ